MPAGVAGRPGISGYFGVATFFVISGFIIDTTCGDRSAICAPRPRSV